MLSCGVWAIREGGACVGVCMPGVGMQLWEGHRAHTDHKQQAVL